MPAAKLLKLLSFFALLSFLVSCKTCPPGDVDCIVKNVFGNNDNDNSSDDDTITDVNISPGTGSPSVSVGGSPSVSVGGSPSVSVGGSPSVSVGGSPSVSVGASPSVAVGGSPSVSVGGSPSVSVGGSPSVSVGGSPSVAVGGGSPSVSVGGSPSVSLGGSPSVSVGGGSPSVSVGGGSPSVSVGGGSPSIVRTSDCDGRVPPVTVNSINTDVALIALAASTLQTSSASEINDFLLTAGSPLSGDYANPLLISQIANYDWDNNGKTSVEGDRADLEYTLLVSLLPNAAKTPEMIEEAITKSNKLPLLLSRVQIGQNACLFCELNCGEDGCVTVCDGDPDDGTGAGVGAGAGPNDGTGAGVGAGAGPNDGTGAGAGVGAGPNDGTGAGVGAGAGPNDGTGAGVGAGAGPNDGTGAGVGAGAGPNDGTGAGVGAGAGPNPTPTTPSCSPPPVPLNEIDEAESLISLIGFINPEFSYEELLASIEADYGVILDPTFFTPEKVKSIQEYDWDGDGIKASTNDSALVAAVSLANRRGGNATKQSVENYVNNILEFDPPLVAASECVFAPAINPSPSEVITSPTPSAPVTSPSASSSPVVCDCPPDAGCPPGVEASSETFEVDCAAGGSGGGGEDVLSGGSDSITLPRRLTCTRSVCGSVKTPEASPTPDLLGCGDTCQPGAGNPIALGTNEPDSFDLDAASTGTIDGGNGDDNFNYSGASIGALDTFLVGGAGSDSLVVPDATAAQAITALKGASYSIELRDNGFALVTASGQKVVFSEVEKISFSDASFDLTKPEDLSAFLGAVTGAGIEARDQRGGQTFLNPFASLERCEKSLFCDPSSNTCRSALNVSDPSCGGILPSGGPSSSCPPIPMCAMIACAPGTIFVPTPEDPNLPKVDANGCPIFRCGGGTCQPDCSLVPKPLNEITLADAFLADAYAQIVAERSTFEKAAPISLEGVVTRANENIQAGILALPELKASDYKLEDIQKLAEYDYVGNGPFSQVEDTAVLFVAGINNSAGLGYTQEESQEFIAEILGAEDFTITNTCIDPNILPSIGPSPSCPELPVCGRVACNAFDQQLVCTSSSPDANGCPTQGSGCGCECVTISPSASPCVPIQCAAPQPCLQDFKSVIVQEAAFENGCLVSCEETACVRTGIAPSPSPSNPTPAPELGCGETCSPDGLTGTCSNGLVCLITGSQVGPVGGGWTGGTAVNIYSTEGLIGRGGLEESSGPNFKSEADRIRYIEESYQAEQLPNPQGSENQQNFVGFQDQQTNINFSIYGQGNYLGRPDSAWNQFQASVMSEPAMTQSWGNVPPASYAEYTGSYGIEPALAAPWREVPAASGLDSTGAIQASTSPNPQNLTPAQLNIYSCQNPQCPGANGCVCDGNPIISATVSSNCTCPEYPYSPTCSEREQVFPIPAPDSCGNPNVCLTYQCGPIDLTQTGINPFTTWPGLLDPTQPPNTDPQVPLIQTTVPYLYIPQPETEVLPVYMRPVQTPRPPTGISGGEAAINNKPATSLPTQASNQG